MWKYVPASSDVEKVDSEDLAALSGEARDPLSPQSCEAYMGIVIRAFSGRQTQAEFCEA